MTSRRSSTVLVTARLRLREVTAKDAEFMLRLVTDPDWVRFIGDTHVQDLEGAREYVAERLAPLYVRDRGLGLRLVELGRTGEPLGLCGLVVREGLEHPDLGFALLPEYRGAGYAQEASEAVVEHARDTLRLAKLLAVTQTDNRPSIALLERLGFEREGSRSLTPDGTPLELYAHVLGAPIPEFGERIAGVPYRLRPGGYVLFLSDARELAVVRVPGGLYLPGGGREAGETLEQAAEREVREECGLRVRVGARFYQADQLVHSSAKRVHVRKRCSFFRAELEGPGGPPTEVDHELLWLRPDQAARELQHASQRRAVSLAFGLEADAGAS